MIVAQAPLLTPIHQYQLQDLQVHIQLQALQAHRALDRLLQNLLAVDERLEEDNTFLAEKMKPLFVLFTLSLYFIKSQSASEAFHIVDQEIGYGARSLSMGGAFTALGDGSSGMYWNPAGLADVNNGQVYAESYNLFYKNNTLFLGNSYANPFTVSRVNGVGVLYPVATVRGSLVFGIGYNRIHHYDNLMSFAGYSKYNNDMEFPINTDGQLLYYRFNQNVERYEKIMSNGARDHLTLSFGIALSPNLAGGISISKMSGIENYDFEFLQKDIADNYQQFPADFLSYEVFQSLKTETEAWKLRGGVKYIYSPFQFGLSIATPYVVNVVEHHGTQERLIFDNADYSDTLEFGYYDYKVQMPATIDIGVAFVTDVNLSFSIGYRIQDWSKMQFNLMDFSALSEEYKTMSVENDFIDQEYRMISQMRVGVEGLIPFSETFGLTARAGMAFIPSPQRSGTAEKQISSFGLGIPFQRRVILDFAFIHSFQKKVSNDSYVPSDVVEEIRKSEILLNVSYLF